MTIHLSVHEGSKGAIWQRRSDPMSQSHTAHNDNATTQPIKRRGNGLYLTIWSLLGLSAAVYLVLIAIGRPLPVGTILDWTGDDPASVKLRKSAEISGETSSAVGWSRVNRDIAILKDKVANVSETVVQLSTQQQQNTQRVTRLETWQSVVVRGSGTVVDTFRTGAADQGTTVTEAVVKQRAADLASNSAIEGTTLDGVTRTTPLSQAPTASIEDKARDAAILAALLNKKPDAGATIGAIIPGPTTVSVPAPVEPEVAPVPQAPSAVVPLPGRRTFGVELGSGDSVDSLRLTWALLNERHRDLVGSLAPRYVRSGSGQNSLYRLIAGPFPSSNGARELCTQLQAYYVSCQASAFTGSVL